MKRILGLALAGVLFSAVQATAAPCDTVLTEVRNYGPATPNFNRTLTFDQYTGLLSDVCSVQVILQLDINGGFLGVDNDGANPAHVDVQLGANANISSTDVTLLDFAFQPVTGQASAFSSDSFDLAGDNGDGAGNVDTTGPDGAVHLGTADKDMKSGFINSLFWAGFVGAGTYDIKMAASQILDFGGVGGVEGNFGPVNASGYVKVIYTVPEPATMSLLGLGALAMLRRRRA